MSDLFAWLILAPICAMGLGYFMGDEDVGRFLTMILFLLYIIGSNTNRPHTSPTVEQTLSSQAALQTRLMQVQEVPILDVPIQEVLATVIDQCSSDYEDIPEAIDVTLHSVQ